MRRPARQQRAPGNSDRAIYSVVYVSSSSSSSSSSRHWVEAAHSSTTHVRERIHRVQLYLSKDNRTACSGTYSCCSGYSVSRLVVGTRRHGMNTCPEHVRAQVWLAIALSLLHLVSSTGTSDPGEQLLSSFHHHRIYSPERGRQITTP